MVDLKDVWRSSRIVSYKDYCVPLRRDWGSGVRLGADSCVVVGQWSSVSNRCPVSWGEFDSCYWGEWRLCAV